MKERPYNQGNLSKLLFTNGLEWNHLSKMPSVLHIIENNFGGLGQRSFFRITALSVFILS